MAKPWIHSQSSTRKFGGKPEDYGLNVYDEDDNFGNDDAETLCSNCEEEITETAKFCAACGTPVSINEEAPDMGKIDRERASVLVAEMLRMFDDAILKDVYGDHCMVTIHRNGRAEVKEYSHD